MEVHEAIRTRRNIMKFKPDPVDESKLLGWLEEASLAPNHKMAEPWEVLLIGAETRKELNHKADFGGAPIVLAVLSTPAGTAIDRDEHVMAASCFVQNLLLAAHADGVGVRWTSIGASPRNRELMGVREGYEVIGVFGVGYPADVPEAKPRTPIAEKVRRLP